MLARAPGFEEALLVVDIDPADAVGRRLRDVRRRALARERGDRADVPIVHARRRRASRRAALEPRSRRRSTSSSRCGSRSSSACATTSTRTASATIVIGVSGGIDSALTAALAVEALGAERVHCVSMPSRYSSGGHARRRAAARREPRHRLPRAADRADRRARSTRRCAERFAGPRARPHRGEPAGARSAASLLMALSNKFGWLVVATGNKSELSVGYATLYGDMAGGFALLKDVFKTDVFRLARHLNERAGRELIPQIDHRARAERGAARRPARRGLAAAVPDARPGARGVRRAGPLARGALAATASTRTSSSARVALIDRAEYKRRQAPPGVRSRPKAFGRDRRTPITNRWTGGASRAFGALAHGETRFPRVPPLS